MLTRAEKIQLLALQTERLNRRAKNELLAFTEKTMPTFEPADFHIRYYNKLTEFAEGDIKKLMVFIPPQHGKSEGSTRRLPAFLLGKNPDLRIAIVSYSASKARKFNRELQRVIDTDEYREIFPNTTLNGKNVSTIATSWLRNADECEIVNHKGGFKTVGVGGALTGEPVDILIMDDIYKDAQSAWSPVTRSNIEDWYDTVAETRLHNNSRQLIVFTRWHEHDLAGKLLAEQGELSVDNPNGWDVVSYPAIKVGEPTDYDPRYEGEALWPERHSIERLEEVRRKNPFVFESLYQQNPKPQEGLMYTNLRTYETIPIENYHKVVRKCYIDTADTGADFLCAICYEEHPTAMYITDVLYTNKPMEYTEPETAKMLVKNNIQIVNVESNNGGRGFARNVEQQVRLLGNRKMSFHLFTQSNNKQVRIFSHSAEVQNMVYFPANWETTFARFATDVKGYLKEGRNAHDDSVDAITGMTEFFGTNGQLVTEEDIFEDFL